MRHAFISACVFAEMLRVVLVQMHLGFCALRPTHLTRTLPGGSLFSFVGIELQENWRCALAAELFTVSVPSEGPSPAFTQMTTTLPAI